MSGAIDSSALAAQLQAGCAALCLELRAGQQQLLLAYLALLVKWNRAYNLTGVQDPAAMVTLHLLDSLTLAPYLCGARGLDVGSGAGLPGLVLAVFDPTRHWVLLDSNGKKTRFLTQVCVELGLGNIEVVQARMQDYRAPEPFDLIVSRALADLGKLRDGTRHLLAPGGSLITMKGTLPAHELAQCPDLAGSCEVRRVQVPGLAAERHVLIVRPGGEDKA